jgi:RNA polymerase sigma factor (sigma-70 family)
VKQGAASPRQREQRPSRLSKDRQPDTSERRGRHANRVGRNARRGTVAGCGETSISLESLAGFDRTRGRADQWLFGIARNVLGESYRRGRVEAAARARLGLPELILDDHAASTIARLSVEGESASVALSTLPADQRQAVEERVLRERDYPEIAGELRCSEALVRKRVSRGLRALRTRLAGER